MYLLAFVGVYLECQAEGCAVLVFDLADVAKALVQFERSSDASQEATAQLVQVTVVEEAFLALCLCWLVGSTSAFFGHAVTAVLPLNMVDPWLVQHVPFVAGGCY
jgi:hypothetical protein